MGRRQLPTFHDVAARHEGYEISADYSYRWVRGRFSIAPSVGVAYKSAALSDYYWGVHADEVLPSLQGYEVDGGIGWEVGLRTSYYVTKSMRIAVSANYERLQDRSREPDRRGAGCPRLLRRAGLAILMRTRLTVLRDLLDGSGSCRGRGARAPGGQAAALRARQERHILAVTFDIRWKSVRAGEYCLIDEAQPVRCAAGRRGVGQTQPGTARHRGVHVLADASRWHRTRRRGENRSVARGLHRPAARAAFAARVGCPMNGTNVDILLIEDDNRLAELTATYLEQNGLRVAIEERGTARSSASRARSRDWCSSTCCCREKTA